MLSKFLIVALCGSALAFSGVAVTSADAQGQRATSAKKTTKKAAKKMRPVPVSMAAPRSRTRITVQRRSFLDPGREVLPGSQSYFTDYAFPPGYSPTSVIENRAGLHRSPLPGPFDLPGRNNPWPWNYCVGC